MSESRNFVGREWKKIQKMSRQMIKKIKELVYQACQRKTNYYGPNIWEHMELVVKNGKMLAKKLDADEEIVEIASWLHDYAAISNRKWRLDHHIYGTKLAEALLKKFGYPNKKIEQVKHCIYAHRASKKIPRRTLEAKIVASADAMAHFSHLAGLFYLVYQRKRMDLKKGKKWVLAKLERSWQKLMPEAKSMVRVKYQTIKHLLY